jgi:signal transduction histidine kinase
MHDTEREKKAVRNIRTATKRLSRMVSDLSDASLVESKRLALRKEPANLVRLVQDIVDRTVELTSGHKVSVRTEGGIPEVSVDPGRVEQVLSNLLSNAAKYSKPAAEIHVEISRQASDVKVAVINEGAGIPAEDLPRLFTRFHRSKMAGEQGVPGLGLGLYIARGLVEAQGGRIGVDSRMGQETTFWFTIPVTSS